MTWWLKILGGFTFFIGLNIVIGFPWLTEYQPAPMGRAGVVIGLILMGLGIYWMTL